MAFQTVFKRHEMKYILTASQKEKILTAMDPYMQLDKYGRTTIRNIYYDTDTYLLIRRSIERPAYKEKLRIRSYAKAQADSTVFVELKKKYKHVVYKRRISLSEAEAMEWLAKKRHCHKHTQISQEVDYFLDYYATLHPVVFLSYEREAYFEKSGGDFRVTFDDTILARQEDLSLASDVYGTALLPEGMVLMEIKCSGGLPLWMTQVLSEERIYKTSYSKYGTVYKQMIFPILQKEYSNKNANDLKEAVCNA
ncbi:MAG: polyphosphate polymerase domain-containing protein [Ruminococcaceae bacterium]|nr:polyphosphate polymerase domain-containing protein [Oscillospiraceae bacterium]MBE6966609.1 polyphosphate polymerase domain-containing protein [Oscillospiraceae bacterium]